MRSKRWALRALIVAWLLLTAIQAHADRKRSTTRDQPHNTTSSSSEIRTQLVAIMPLSLPTHNVGDGSIKSPVLCYCLHKGPQMVAALRHQAAAHFQRGLTALQARDESAAVAAFTKAIQLNPRDALAYVNRGLAYSRTGNLLKAQADFSRSLDRDSRQSVAYYARGLIAFLLGQPSAAKRDLHQAATLGDARARAVLEKGLAT